MRAAPGFGLHPLGQQYVGAVMLSSADPKVSIRVLAAGLVVGLCVRIQRAFKAFKA